jgi:hypothetical protein
VTAHRLAAGDGAAHEGDEVGEPGEERISHDVPWRGSSMWHAGASSTKASDRRRDYRVDRVHHPNKMDTIFPGLTPD